MTADKSNNIPTIAAAAVETALVAARLEALAPLGGAATGIIANYLMGRFQSAAAIFKSATAEAGAEAGHFRGDDQLASAAHRYARAVRDQAADANLRILADAMIGLARREELWATDFLKYADIIAPLSRDELILIGLMMAEDQTFYESPRPRDSGGDLWKIVVTAAVTVPPVERLFPSVKHLDAVAARALRSGLILPIAGFDGTSYELSPMGREFRAVVNIGAALKAHPPESRGR